MQTVILAAGRGTRMGELTNDIPKPMLKVSGRPILEYIFLNLPEEISEVILVIGYKGDIIKNHFGNEFLGKKIIYSEQMQLDGTGGAVMRLKNMVGEKFMVLMGDDLYRKKDLERLLQYDLAVMVQEIEKNERFGVVDIDDDYNLKSIIEFKDIKERPKHNLINTGAYIINKNFFDYPLVWITEKEAGLPQTMAQMVDKYKIKVIKGEFWHPNGRAEDLQKAEEAIKNQALADGV